MDRYRIIPGGQFPNSGFYVVETGANQKDKPVGYHHKTWEAAEAALADLERADLTRWTPNAPHTPATRPSLAG